MNSTNSLRSEVSGQTRVDRSKSNGSKGKRARGREFFKRRSLMNSTNSLRSEVSGQTRVDRSKSNGSA